MSDPLIHAHPWMTCAIGMIGLAEIKGPRHNEAILRMWEVIKAPWFRDDETPWCAGYVGCVLENSGIRSTRSAAARSYSTWGDSIPGCDIWETGLGRLRIEPDSIPYGAVVVLSRPGSPKSGHVGFYCGPSGSGFALLGGNQNDAVRVSSYLWSRIVSVRWPKGYALPAKPNRFPALASLAPSTSDA